MNRRESLRALAIGAAAVACGRRSALAAAPAKLRMTVYKDPSCGCCKAWVKHVQANGFVVNAVDVSDLSPYKKKYRVTDDLAACHTAVVDGGYVIEGHVPADLIKKLLAERPADARGLAVPGMPMGAPGMEMGAQKDAYDVVLFDTHGKHRVYARR